MNLCSLVSAFYRMKTFYRWSRLVVSFCILLSDWFFFLTSDWLMDTALCHLIGQISRLLIGWTRSIRFWVGLNKFTIGHFRSRIRDKVIGRGRPREHPKGIADRVTSSSRGSPTGDVS